MEVARSAPTILLIDANRAERKDWKRRLSISSPDYVVLEADTGAVGLHICESLHIDCVITELTLPDMSGFEVLVHLAPRATRPEIAVILLTHTALPPMATFALNKGAQAYLIKSLITGACLDRVIHEAIAAVGSHQHGSLRLIV